MLLIWLGAVVMVLGGALSLSDRRLRDRRAEAGQERQARDAAGGVSCERRAQMLALQSLLFAIALATHRRRSRCSPTKSCPTRRLKRARARCQANCAAWCARTSRSTISDAPLARDLRVLVRERLKAGDSDTQVLDFLTARYGQFVLLKPRFGWDTALLWLAPAGVLLAGVWGLVALLRRQRGRPPGQLPTSRNPGSTAAERGRLAQLLDDGGNSTGPVVLTMLNNCYKSLVFKITKV